MSRYLYPKADMVFKKTLGEHPDLLKNFLNALLPLDEITELTGLSLDEINSLIIA